MKLPLKILQIDEDYRISYILIFDGIRIKSPLALEKALSMLGKQTFDIILSIPQNLVVHTQIETSDSLKQFCFQGCRERFDRLPATEREPIGR
ncbi:MAG TPA: hypothetical protein VK564_00310 [Thermodesulfobacteriota bacterium]|nr:hypothetical protein [Thermodesulfobacteriota bacterium]